MWACAMVRMGRMKTLSFAGDANIRFGLPDLDTVNESGIGGKSRTKFHMVISSMESSEGVMTFMISPQHERGWGTHCACVRRVNKRGTGEEVRSEQG